jgi:Family of unknown function (DUF6328)
MFRRSGTSARSSARQTRWAAPTRRDDAWNATQRGELALKRADRNFAELLQELRVAQTGVQMLFAFLLGLSFTERFAALDTAQRDIYVVTLVASALTGILLVAPVATHRLLFQRGCKRDVVRIGHRLAFAGLCGLLATIVGGLLLVLDVVVGRPAAIGGAAALTAAFAGLWIGPALAVCLRGEAGEVPRPPETIESAPTVSPRAIGTAISNKHPRHRLRGRWTTDGTGRLTLTWELIGDSRPARSAPAASAREAGSASGSRGHSGRGCELRLDVRTHSHGAVAGQADVLGGVGADAGGGEEHRALDLGRLQLSQHIGYVGRAQVADRCARTLSAWSEGTQDTSQLVERMTELSVPPEDRSAGTG